MKSCRAVPGTRCNRSRPPSTQLPGPASAACTACAERARRPRRCPSPPPPGKRRSSPARPSTAPRCGRRSAKPPRPGRRHRRRAAAAPAPAGGWTVTAGGRAATASASAARPGSPSGGGAGRLGRRTRSAAGGCTGAAADGRPGRPATPTADRGGGDRRHQTSRRSPADAPVTGERGWTASGASRAAAVPRHDATDPHSRSACRVARDGVRSRRAAPARPGPPVRGTSICATCPTPSSISSRLSGIDPGRLRRHPHVDQPVLQPAHHQRRRRSPRRPSATATPTPAGTSAGNWRPGPRNVRTYAAA